MRPVCLITGGSGKLGTALAERLLPTHELILAYHRHEPPVLHQLRQTAETARDDLAMPFAIQADLRKVEDQRRLVQEALARFGQIDVLINSAADIKFHGPLLDLAFTGRAEIDQLDLNCVQPMRLASLIYQASWKHDPTGNAASNRCVVNVSSISGLAVFAGAGQAFYAASKAALNHLTRFLSEELRPYSVRANALCPSRFPDSVPTERVVHTILDLIEGHENGRVLEVSRSGQWAGNS
jgi:NAD(P)-dependent dehydrogenase (short-subunit alcohol dehydrogenase family)